jgi:C-terminal processing protease CtpA/Prc
MAAALPALTRRLPDGDVLEYAVGDFVTSNGHRVEGEGVIPDEVVTLTVDGLLAGRDVDLDAALVWIDRKPRG